MSGMMIFGSVAAAIASGFEILSVYRDSEGNLLARVRTSTGWALALVRP